MSSSADVKVPMESQSQEEKQKNREEKPMSARTEHVWNKRKVCLGDTVFLWRGNKQLPQSFVVERGKEFHNDFGVFAHDDMVGTLYGARIFSIKPKARPSKGKKRARTAKGFMYVLPFSPELWTLSLPHRTQILYSTDNSLITSHLHLRPGCRVAESGTGSGSLSTALARALAPTGRLDTFEFNQSRYEEVKKDFAKFGLQELITVHLRDVCAKGFGDGKKGVFDAVFLDLPRPWEAIKFARDALKPHGRICSFSPCIEQVQRACKTLSEQGFYCIETFECLRKEYKLSTVHAPTPRCLLDESQTNSLDRKGDSKEKTLVELESTTKPPAGVKTGKTVVSFQASRPFGEMAGHTGYLTFAYR